MDLLFVADPLEAFNVKKDTTFAMMREAARRGHAIFACEPKDLAWRQGGRVEAPVRSIELTGEAGGWFIEQVPVGRRAAPKPDRAPWATKGPLRSPGGSAAALAASVGASDGRRERRALSTFGAVLMRKDPPFDGEYFYATHLLEQAEREGARVFNKPRALRDHPEKLAILEFAQWIAPSIVTRDEAALRRFHAEQGDIILKPLDGMGGAGIFRVGADGLNLGSIVETLNARGAHTVMAQRYLPAIAEGDKRVLVIAGKPVPHVLARIPQGSEIRGNLAVGGKGVARPLAAEDRAIADALGPTLAARGLLLVGLDVIGDRLSEINVTSPTCFQEITEQTGCDVAAIFISALEAALA